MTSIAASGRAPQTTGPEDPSQPVHDNQPDPPQKPEPRPEDDAKGPVGTAVGKAAAAIAKAIAEAKEREAAGQQPEVSPTGPTDDAREGAKTPPSRGHNRYE